MDKINKMNKFPPKLSWVVVVLILVSMGCEATAPLHSPSFLPTPSLKHTTPSLKHSTPVLVEASESNLADSSFARFLMRELLDNKCTRRSEFEGGVKLQKCLQSDEVGVLPEDLAVGVLQGVDALINLIGDMQDSVDQNELRSKFDEIVAQVTAHFVEISSLDWQAIHDLFISEDGGLNSLDSAALQELSVLLGVDFDSLENTIVDQWNQWKVDHNWDFPQNLTGTEWEALLESGLGTKSTIRQELLQWGNETIHEIFAYLSTQENAQLLEQVRLSLLGFDLSALLREANVTLDEFADVDFNLTAFLNDLDFDWDSSSFTTFNLTAFLNDFDPEPLLELMNGLVDTLAPRVEALSEIFQSYNVEDLNIEDLLGDLPETTQEAVAAARNALCSRAQSVPGYHCWVDVGEKGKEVGKYVNLFINGFSNTGIPECTDQQDLLESLLSLGGVNSGEIPEALKNVDTTVVFQFVASTHSFVDEICAESSTDGDDDGDGNDDEESSAYSRIHNKYISLPLLAGIQSMVLILAAFPF